MSSPLVATGSTAPAEMSLADRYRDALSWVRAQIGRATGMCGTDPKGRQLLLELRKCHQELGRVLDGGLFGKE